MGPLPGLEGVPEDLGSCLEFPEALLGNLKSSGDMLVLWVVLVESGGGVDEGQNEGKVLACPSKSGLQWGMGGEEGPGGPVLGVLGAVEEEVGGGFPAAAWVVRVRCAVTEGGCAISDPPVVFSQGEGTHDQVGGEVIPPPMLPHMLEGC